MPKILTEQLLLHIISPQFFLNPISKSVQGGDDSLIIDANLCCKIDLLEQSYLEGRGG